MKAQRLTYLFFLTLLIPFLGRGQEIVTPIQNTIIENIKKVEQQNVYKNPQLEIVAQNKKLLGYSLVWDEDATLNVTVVSIIGNVFFSEEVTYSGKPIEAVINISEYSTGLYLLKISDVEEETILFRKFTKY